MVGVVFSSYIYIPKFILPQTHGTSSAGYAFQHGTPGPRAPRLAPADHLWVPRDERRPFRPFRDRSKGFNPLGDVLHGSLGLHHAHGAVKRDLRRGRRARPAFAGGTAVVSGLSDRPFDRRNGDVGSKNACSTARLSNIRPFLAL